MPLSRLLTVLIGLILVGGLIAYSLQTDGKSSASVPETPTEQFDSKGSEEQNFLKAGTLPADFQTLSLPVQLEKIDSMIQHCGYLLNQDNNYQEEIKSKLISLHAFKCITMSQNNIASTSAVQELESVVNQVAESEAGREEYGYLIAFVHMANLAFFPDTEHYDRAISAINSINESTPILPAKAIGCYNSALEFYDESDDKAAAKKLLHLLGSKLTLAKEQRFLDLGLSLMDYPIYSTYLQKTDGEDQDISSAKTNQLLELIRKTPPKSEYTYNVLIKLPEYYLETGSAKIAAMLLAEIKSAATKTEERFRDKLEAQINTIGKRIALLGKPFALTGNDVKGRPLRPTKKENTIVIFWSPRDIRSLNTLVWMHDSSLYDQWTNELLVASDTELSPEDIAKFVKQFSHFRFLDFPTSTDWIQKSGVTKSPFIMIVDKQGLVKRFSTP